MGRRRVDAATAAAALLPLAALFDPAAAAFSLDTVVQDVWYYVHNHLADTTSVACLAAYAAPIGCDDTLLGMVSSSSPNFDPGPRDLERVCVPACEAALAAWVENVSQACVFSEDGDAALVSSSQKPRPRVPVATVGEVFLYEYAYACAKNESSGWCYLSYPGSSEWARDDFTCGNKCAEQFFTNARELPGSQYWFIVYELDEVSDWWKDQWDLGWQTVLQCREQEGKDGDTSSSSSSSSRSRSSKTTTTTSAETTPTTDIETTSSIAGAETTSGSDESTTSSAPETMTFPSSTSASAAASVTSELPASTSDSAAGRLKSPFRGIW